MAPVVFAIELWVIFAAVAVKLCKAVDAPIAPPKAMLEVPAVTVKLLAPLIVLEKLTNAPAVAPLVVSIAVLALKLTGPFRFTAPELVVKLPPRVVKVEPL